MVMANPYTTKKAARTTSSPSLMAAMARACL